MATTDNRTAGGGAARPRGTVLARWRPALDGLLRCRCHRPTLRAEQDLRGLGGNRFERTGPAPRLDLDFVGGPAPGGWCLLRLCGDGHGGIPTLLLRHGADWVPLETIRTRDDADGTAVLARLPDQPVPLALQLQTEAAHIKVRSLTLTALGPLALAAHLIRQDPALLPRLLTAGSPARARLRLSDHLARRRDAGYARWIDLHDRRGPADIAAIRAHIARMREPPLISILMPVYETAAEHLRAAIDSVLGQIYPHWELCIADDASPSPHVGAILADYAQKDPRIRVTRRTENGHIARASNTALEMARGPFVALMDHDDLLSDHALYLVAATLEAHPETDLLYSDEDKVDAAGMRHDPHFKSDWNPELFLHQNMVSHLGVYRTALARRIGGFRPGYEGSQDYDFTLRAVEATAAERIRHIPHILYHWRVFADSGSFSTRALDRAMDAARRAVGDHLARTGTPATVEAGPAGSTAPYHRVRRLCPDPPPPVSLIVPTRDRVDLLRTCLGGLLERTDYPALEVIIADNGSRERETLAYLHSLRDEPRVRVLPLPGPFNFSAINNAAVAAAHGPLVGFINNDVEVIHADWLQVLVAQACRPEVGAVGAKLLYGNGLVQHGGIATGVQGVAGHLHPLAGRNETGYFGRLALAQNLSAVTAACLLMRRALFLKLGGFDAEHLAVAFNDVDLCLRLRQAGYQVIWTPQAELYHHESLSRGSDLDPARIERFRREIAVMQRRWGPVLTRDPYYNPNLSLASGRFAPAFPPRVPKPWLDPPQRV